MITVRNANGYGQSAVGLIVPKWILVSVQKEIEQLEGELEKVQVEIEVYLKQ